MNETRSYHYDPPTPPAPPQPPLRQQVADLSDAECREVLTWLAGNRPVVVRDGLRAFKQQAAGR